MKKTLIVLVLISSLLLASCNERDLPLEETAPDTTVEDTTAAEETTDIHEDTKDVPDEPETTEPDWTEIVFSNENIEIKKLTNGKYSCVRSVNTQKTELFDEVHILEYIDGYGNICKNILLCTVKNGQMGDITIYGENGVEKDIDLSAGGNFKVIGNYIINGYYVYNANLYPIHYIYDETAADSAKYIPETNVLKIGDATLYPTLERVDKLPEDSITLSSRIINDIEEVGIYKHGSDYYYKNDVIVKLPLSGDFDSVMLVYPEMAEFVNIKDGKLYRATVEWQYTGQVGSEWYPGFTATESVVDYMAKEHTFFEYNDFTIIKGEPYSYATKDGQYVYTFPAVNYGAFSRLDDLLIAGSNYSGYTDVTVHRPDLSLFANGVFEAFIKLSDGNYLGWLEDGLYHIYGTDGNIIYSSPDNLRCISIINNHILTTDENNTLRLFTPYGELIHDFGTIPENYAYDRYMSGYFEKTDYDEGYYFVFKDYNDTNEKGENHFYEYYYIPETGESGVYDYYDFEGALAKPVLYLYPTEVTDISVKFEHPELLIVDYPSYNDGWQVTALSDGTLTDSRGRSYYALYWEESLTTGDYEYPDGFCVKGDEAAEFLEKKLEVLGLNEREANEFIMYWLPVMKQNEYNLVRFELTDEREATNALHISPEPDSLLRIAIHIKPIESEIRLPEQKLPTFTRNGFTAIEWGGCVH
ncbi:MAG: hypothetical protein IJY93_06095 [Clostridia bacterium]|nr:hypothetical protein [Clostridia bacterium]